MAADKMANLYDINFCFPVPERIENNRIALTPFIPDLHGDMFLAQAKHHPDMFDYLPFGVLPGSEMTFWDFVLKRMQPSGCVLFCVWDKTQRTTISEQEHSEDGVLAGLIGLVNSSADSLATEIGAVMILPQFHRTHVASNAAGLLLHYALELPTSAQTASTTVSSSSDVFRLTAGHPLGLRRVVWQANVLNAPSVRLAERMGFTREGTLRWDRVLPADKPGNGIKVREGDRKPIHVGRDTALLSLCWDDWEGGAREKVQQTMRRTK